MVQGGVTFPWTSAIVLAPLCCSAVVVGIFCLWEWKGAKLPIVPSKCTVHMPRSASQTGAHSVYLQARDSLRSVYHDVYEVGTPFQWQVTMLNSCKVASSSSRHCTTCRSSFKSFSCIHQSIPVGAFSNFLSTGYLKHISRQACSSYHFSLVN